MQGLRPYQIPAGFFSVSKSCGKCSGTGRLITNPCRKCRGHGAIQEQKTVNLKIPAGVDAGSRLKIVGEGEPGLNSGPNGDLYVILDVQEHEIFKREGTDLFCDLPFPSPMRHSPQRSRCRPSTVLPKLKIPAGTQSGKIFTLKGKGAPRVGSQKGQSASSGSLSKFQKLSQRQKELLEELTSISTDDSNRPSGQAEDLFHRGRELTPDRFFIYIAMTRLFLDGTIQQRRAFMSVGKGSLYFDRPSGAKSMDILIVTDSTGAAYSARISAIHKKRGHTGDY